MENKSITEYTDAELSEIKGNAFRTLMQSQGTIQAIEQEEAKRKAAEKQEPKTKK